MHARLLTVIVLLILIFPVFSGCTREVVKTKLDQLYEKHFEGFETPEVSWVRKGKRQAFPHVTFEQVWDSAIIVLMQNGSIVLSAKETGIIVITSETPLAVFVERGEIITVYVNWLKYLHERLDKPQLVTTVECYTPVKKARLFLDNLATQVYCGEKMKYLYN